MLAIGRTPERSAVARCAVSLVVSFGENDGALVALSHISTSSPTLSLPLPLEQVLATAKSV